MTTKKLITKWTMDFNEIENKLWLEGRKINLKTQVQNNSCVIKCKKQTTICSGKPKDWSDVRQQLVGWIKAKTKKKRFLFKLVTCCFCNVLFFYAFCERGWIRILNLYAYFIIIVRFTIKRGTYAEIERKKYYRSRDRLKRFPVWPLILFHIKCNNIFFCSC